MKFKPISPSLFVSRQLFAADLDQAAASGFRLIVCNRPDGEDRNQPAASEIATAAASRGMAFVHIPVNGTVSDADVAAMESALDQAGGPALAYCGSGNRSTRVGALALASRIRPETLVAGAAAVGFEIVDLTTRLSMRYIGQADAPRRFDVVVVGGGAAGIATTASLLRRRPSLRIAVVDPAERHYYQPGWTMVGAGIFTVAQTERRMADVVPKDATWVQERVVRFDPSGDRVQLADGRQLHYNALVVATGLTLDWAAIPGLEAALGKRGVTSNYRVDLAPYTARLVESLKGGRAIFTQPPMPIKCAGAPQKAMYLSCDA